MAVRQLAATLFPIRGVDTALFRFRIFRIREPIPNDNQRPVRLQRWSDRLWRRELRCPVYPTTRFGWPGFLVPEDSPTTPASTIEITDVPGRTYHLELANEIVEVSLATAEGTERDLLCRMLERPFTDRLMTQRDRFWRAEWTLFFALRPENLDNQRDVVNAYRGFKFGVVLLHGTDPHLAVDTRTRYVGRKDLAATSIAERERVLRQHLDSYLTPQQRAIFLRDNGAVKIPCRYVGLTGKSVAEFAFNSETVYEYYRRTYPAIRVRPDDVAVFVQDRAGGGPSFAVPESRLFPIFTTEFDGVRTCSVRPWMPPQERRDAATRFLRQVGAATFGTLALTVVDEVATAPRTVFAPPSLEFGGGQRLDPFPGAAPGPDDSAFDAPVVRWSSRKYPALLDSGPYHNEPLPDVVVLYPDTLQRAERETFLSDLTREVMMQTRQSLRVVQQRSYASGPTERMGGSLFRAVTEIKSLPARHFALVVLSDRHAESVHGELKDRSRPLPSQCVMESTVRNIASRRDLRRARGQARNLALALATEAGVKPWVLANPLHHDLHVGIDLLYGRVGYLCLYGTGGRLIQRYLGEAQERGRMREAIKRPVLQARLYETVRAIREEGHDVSSIVIHRDGRWWPSEQSALWGALEHLRRGGVLGAEVRCAVVEVRKNHMPVRLFTFDPETRLLQNPLPGTYLLVDEDRALLTTTGRPGAWDAEGGRTAGTILLQVVQRVGRVSLQEIAEDAYRLTQLNWSSPDIEIALPVTIRWTDEALRELLRPPVEDQDVEELEDDNELAVDPTATADDQETEA